MGREGPEENKSQNGKKGKPKEKNRGQNTGRRFAVTRDEKSLCQSVAHHPEFSPQPCAWGNGCKFEHNLRKYLKDYKQEDLTTFNGMCPVWQAKGKCLAGWKCRFVGSHMEERELEDGRKELVLAEDPSRFRETTVKHVGPDGVTNAVSTDDKICLMKRKYDFSKSDAYINWLNETGKELDKNVHYKSKKEADKSGEQAEHDEIEDRRAQYREPPFLPSEKRRLYFGPETPVLSPLTTEGNLPFRRLCVEMGAQFTYSEMAMSMPLIQGQKSEWALMKSHISEALPPRVDPNQTVVEDYDNSRDKKFGAQIAAGKPWQAIKATQALTSLCPHLRLVDLNCGCPIDLVYREGAGSALLDQQGKMEKVLRGMNAVSGEVPITVKIRTGTKENNPTALKLLERLCIGGSDSHEIGQGPPGIAAVTLHGRSRQQRYTKLANWSYISECGALIKRLQNQEDVVTDTIKEADPRTLPSGRKIFMLGNGDCYSHADYYDHVKNSGVDSVMIARGALIKPWIFEEIQQGQYLDKSASERLGLIEKYARYGLDYWGSDEVGVGTTRRFLLEWLSFTYRYLPVGLLEYLPPCINDRPPAWRGRNELEELLASDNYKDWIKIT